jgi:hypothetical protein
LAADQATSGTTSSGAGEPQTFRSVSAVIIWWVWLLFAVGNLIDLAVQGRDHLSLIAAAILLLVTGVAYVAAQRPRIIASDDGITVVNPLRNHHVPWANVDEVDVSDLLRVHCRDLPGKKPARVISAWAVHYSRRRQFTADLKARRAATRSGPPRGYAATPEVTSEAEAERIVRLLNDRAIAAGIEQATERPVARSPLTSTWSWPAITALIVPALLLLIISLV